MKILNIGKVVLLLYQYHQETSLIWKKKHEIFVFNHVLPKKKLQISPQLSILILCEIKFTTHIVLNRMVNFKGQNSRTLLQPIFNSVRAIKRKNENFQRHRIDSLFGNVRSRWLSNYELERFKYISWVIDIYKNHI